MGKSIEIHTKPRSLKRQHHFLRIPNNSEVPAASIAAMQIPTAGIAGDRAVSCVACVPVVVEGLEVYVMPNYWVLPWVSSPTNWASASEIPRKSSPEALRSYEESQLDGYPNSEEAYKDVQLDFMISPQYFAKSSRKTMWKNSRWTLQYSFWTVQKLNHLVSFELHWR